MTSIATMPTSTTQRVSAYLTDEQYEEVRAAYVTDRTRDTDQAPTTLRAWMTRAVETHNARTPHQRTALATQLPTSDAQRTPRSWPLPLDVLAATHQAIAQGHNAATADQGITGYITDAVRIAANLTRTAAGGQLTPAPAVPITRRNSGDPGAAAPSRASAYLTADDFQALRAAHAADQLRHGDQAPRTLGAWVAAAVTRHTHRTPRERAALVAQLPEPSGKRGPRSWPLPPDTITQAEQAITADNAITGTRHTLTSYVTDAVRIATQETRP